ncbi:MAG: hypothetical protein M1414_05560 [Candidatus Thermoplasmatota archaeon]|nr:hypothetical protein [Candidatus Thermoplasmatota archaeon]MCL5988349.1 hypothetical protein [Candidatus Thermoplasmatota archaeon]
MAIAKVVAVGLGVTATGAVAVKSGDLNGLSVALQHVPVVAHAHAVLSGLIKR